MFVACLLCLVMSVRSTLLAQHPGVVSGAMDRDTTPKTFAGRAHPFFPKGRALRRLGLGRGRIGTLPSLHLRGGADSKEKVDDKPKIKGTCVGIDLGTTYSCVAVWKNGRVEVCPNEQGNRITPSYVAWAADGQKVVGDAAKNQAATNPTNTIFDVKRLIGRKFSDASVQKDAKLFPFKVSRKTLRFGHASDT